MVRGLEIEIEEVKTEYSKYVVTHSAKVKVWVSFNYEVVESIVRETWEFLPEDVDDKEIEKYVWELEEEFKKIFEKELIKELKVDYEIKSFKEQDGEYEIELISKDEYDPDWWDENFSPEWIEELKENFMEEVEAIIEDAFGNAEVIIAERIAKKVIESLREEDDKQDKETKEEPVEELKRAVIVASKDFYITLPKSYLKYLYKKFGKVPKWVRFAYYKDGKIVIEPIWSEKEIEKEKLEWFGITKL